MMRESEELWVRDTSDTPRPRARGRAGPSDTPRLRCRPSEARRRAGTTVRVGMKFYNVLLPDWSASVTSLYVINRPVGAYGHARHVPTMVVVKNWEFV